jgi:hypothetical protein
VGSDIGVLLASIDPGEKESSIVRGCELSAACAAQSVLAGKVLIGKTWGVSQEAFDDLVEMLTTQPQFA